MRAALLALAVLLLAPAAAFADATLEDAARSLRSDPVFVDPAAEAAGKVDADALRAKIRDEHAGPMFIAVLPESAAGDQGAGPALSALHEDVGIRGTYALVIGNHFRAGSDLVQASTQATEALQDHPGEVQATLEDFIGRVGDLRAGRRPSGSGGGGGGGGFLGIALLGLVAVGGGSLLLSRRRRRREEAAELAEVKENTRDDLVALGEDIGALDLDVQMPNADPAAREDYSHAVDAYDRANRIFETAGTPEDMAPAAQALEEGRYAMVSAKARLQGRQPPERRPPCFFDPRHGPSARDVEWAPSGGAPRMVPACEADAQRVERGEDPQAREVLLGGRRVPYWDAGPAYAPFYGGFFGGYGGGFLPGLLTGTLLGEALSPGWGGGYSGWGDQGGWGDGGGDFGDGGGDFGDGGGDFGGGDFGGGDFGGGDFGGGDFGGGGGDF